MNIIYLHRPRFSQPYWLIPFFCMLLTNLPGQVFLKRYDSLPEPPGHNYDRHSIIKRPDGLRVFSERRYQGDIRGVRFDTDDDGALQDKQAVILPGPKTKLTHVILSRSGNLVCMDEEFVYRINFSGDTVWGITFTHVGAYSPSGVDELEDGTLYAFYAAYQDLKFYKINPDGVVLSEYHIPVTNLDYLSAFINLIPKAATPDGGFVFSYRSNKNPPNTDPVNSADICRTDVMGNRLWTKNLPENISIYDIKISTNGDVVYRQAVKDSLPYSKFSLWRIDQAGETSLLLNLDSIFPRTYVWSGFLLPCENGDMICTETYKDTLGASRVFFMRFTTSGQIRWLDFPEVFNNQPYPAPNIGDGLEMPDGSLVFAGTWQDKPILYKIRPDGTPTRITGAVAVDQNVDCMVNAGELPLSKFWITISDDQYSYRYRTDGQGKYHAKVDTGDYTVQVHPNSHLWEACDSTVTVSLPDTGMVAVADFPLQPLVDCPLMTVDVFTPLLHRCFSSVYHVSYCNNGTVAADSARIVIDLDPGLIFEDSSIPATVDGQQLTFELGQVLPNHCGAFLFRVIPDCNTVQLGEIKCVAAHIYPDSLCGDSPPGWTGASIELRAICTGDSILFTLYNTGKGPMQHPQEYVIIDDHVIMKSGAYWLTAGDSMTIAIKAKGSPVRLIAAQEPGHPVSWMPSIGIESCGDSTQVVLGGFLNEFPNQSGSPFEDIFCKEVVGAYDPNDKNAIPTGFSSGHWIYPETELDYVIRFQNEGSYAASRVVVIDTLSSFLDPASIRGETASHAFRMEMNPGNVLAFIFDGIYLPPSGSNYAASQGWVRFKARPKAGLPDGAPITNRAGIYFDYNEPVITNTVFHRIGRRFWGVIAQQEPALPARRLQLWPNPTTDMIFFDAVLPDTHCRVVDMMGRSLIEQTITGEANGSLSCRHLPKGIYRLELSNEAGLIGSGIFVRH